ncbi:hypothetical protein FRB95_004576 [Tulasnella sp. JGI-2019a]|nr:hypothetical protein FRB95_004576 [Tulasnella sp. JGI-2019a]
MELDASDQLEEYNQPMIDQDMYQNDDTEIQTFDHGSFAATTSAGEGGLLARRSKNGSQKQHDHPRLALVAPPDAALGSYTDLTPPDMLVIGGSPRSAPPRKEGYGFIGEANLGIAGDRDNERMRKDHRRTKSHSIEQPRMMSATGSATAAAGLFNKRRGGQLSPRSGMVFRQGDYTSYPEVRADATYSEERETALEEPELLSSATTSISTFTGTSPSYSTAPSTSPHDDLNPKNPMHLFTAPPIRQFSRQNTDESVIITPVIGEAKDPMTKVAAPIVIDVSNATRLPATAGSIQTSAVAKEVVPAPPTKLSIRAPTASGNTPPPRPPRLHSPTTNGIRRLAVGPSARQKEKGTDSASVSPASEILLELKQEPANTLTPGIPSSPLSQSKNVVSLPSSSPLIDTQPELRSMDSLEEIPILPPGHHRREPANASCTSRHRSESTSGPDPDRTITIVSPPSPDLAPSMQPIPQSQAHQNFQLAPQRPELFTSRWDSHRRPNSSRSSRSSRSSGGRSGLEDLMEAVGEAIENIGLVRVDEITPTEVDGSPRAMTVDDGDNGETALNAPATASPSGGSQSSSPSSSHMGMHFTPTPIPPTAELRSPTRGSPGTSSRPLSGQADYGTKMLPTPPAQTNPPMLVDLSSPLKNNAMSGTTAANGNGVPIQRWDSASPGGSPPLEVLSSPVSTQPPSSFPPSNPEFRRYSGEGARSGQASRPRSIRSIKRFSILHQRTPSSQNLNQSFQQQQSNWPKFFPDRNQGRRLGAVGSGMPDAMSCKDVVTKKTALERAAAYEQKMRELLHPEAIFGGYGDDRIDGGSGLGEWIIFVKRCQPNQQRQIRQRQEKPLPRPRHLSSAASTISASSTIDNHTSTPTTPNSALPPIPPLQGQQGMRHVSHGSEASEATFPKRADAYVATDLRSGPSAGRESPPPGKGPPPNIPYPGLVVAQQQQQQQQQKVAGLGIKTSNSVRAAAGALVSPSRSATVTSPVKSGGFFASIGRKASMKGKERPAFGDLAKKGIGAGMGMLTNRPSQVNIPSSQPKTVVAKPSLIGGPRPQRPAATGSPRSATKDTTAPSPIGTSPKSSESVMVIERQSIDSRSSGVDGSPGGASMNASSTRSENRNALARNSVGSNGESGYSTQVERDRYDTDAGMESDVGHLPTIATYQNHSTNSAQKLISRSSQSYRSLTSPNLPAITAFNANLDKVQDVLPHVERDVLALYLKRANGDDIRAIGVYLDDERKGIVMGQ